MGFVGIMLSKFRFNFNSIQTLKSRLHGKRVCHIRFGDLCKTILKHMCVTVKIFGAKLSDFCQLVAYFGRLFGMDVKVDLA